MNRDDRHLQLLSRCHYGLAIGMLALVAAVVGLAVSGHADVIPKLLLLPAVALAILIMLAGGESGGDAGGEGDFAVFFGSMILGVVFGVVLVILVMLASAAWVILLAVSGWLLKRQRGYRMCYLVAIVSCAFFPLGTALGIFTLKVLSRPGVRDRFAQNSRRLPPAPPLPPPRPRQTSGRPSAAASPITARTIWS